MPKPAWRVLESYKQLCRQANRLPLDRGTISRFLALVKLEFRTGSPLKSSQIPVSRKKYNLLSQQLDSILIEEKYDEVQDLLDVIYKREPPPSWLREFNELNYTQMKGIWPQVHLIRELTKDAEVISKYNKSLELEKNEDFSMMRHFSLTSAKEGLSLVRSYSQSPDLKPMMKSVSSLYNLLLDNQSKLSRSKIQSLEVVYPTNRFALPISPHKRDRMLRDKIASVRNLLHQYKPIPKHDLQRLIDVSLGKEGAQYEINPNFYKYMIKKHRIEKQEMNIAVLRKLRQKHLVPNENNIRKWFRAYVVKQFYLDDDGQHKMSWMQNYYDIGPSSTR
ncbi:uncharacterized protein CANTADRAFT_3646 [Suhomyces tanzawaensis NRRL Y-17324]|uniref:Genetic interactor of prohibitin 5, mitochondrial n=1 Tax=Suhomyces tanzawaensis NRRL Y-17324 TaxID=984487 RepID=A0A1E4SQ67_9ASCO|nr:uncharacterized protein CANTADRAFT_3646 [Suhomyces tanzawaensis NRRL Y-17324]ODV81552.1 hypothetical protein CANTADRAFT_3646 [Suhomyces tanzawaensis NRRL Y-17324]